MQVDLAAVSRIARRVDLQDLRLVELAATHSPGDPQQLEPNITFECSAERPVPDRIIAFCEYHFAAKSRGETIAEVHATYVMLYELLEDMDITASDLQQFAHANGTYHSWPFLRQLLFDLTSKMGLPPFTLPVFKVLPRETNNEKALTEQGTETKAAQKKLSKPAKHKKQVPSAK